MDLGLSITLLSLINLGLIIAFTFAIGLIGYKILQRKKQNKNSETVN